MINKKMILLDQEFQTKDEVLKEYSKIATQADLILNEENFLKALWDREALLPTSIGQNIAIPHCQSDTVLNPFVGLIRNKKLIPWDDKEDANIIFVIAIPQETSGQVHLKTLAKLSRKLINQEFMETLLEADLETSYMILKTTLEEE